MLIVVKVMVSGWVASVSSTVIATGQSNDQIHRKAYRFRDTLYHQVLENLGKRLLLDLRFQVQHQPAEGVAAAGSWQLGTSVLRHL